MSKTAAFLSLGCKVNSYEVSSITEMFQNDGFEIVPFSQKADVYVINTCTVTHMADHKSRQMLHRARKKNPDAVIAAMGCYVECQEEISKDISVDIYTGNKNKGEILTLVKNELKRRENEETKKGEYAVNHASPTEDNINSPVNVDAGKRERLMKAYKEGRQSFEELPAGSPQDRTRVFLKIQDGCSQFCSYCIIPYARGPVRSRRPENILEEAERLIEKGYKEFVLTGIHLTSYGMDEGKTGGKDLCGIMEMLDRLPGIERIRLGSLEPAFITEENVKRMACLKHLCPHFHLSLQSGSEAILKKMNRRYTPEIFMGGAELLKKAFFYPALTTDIIVGFPGEYEKEFGESLKFVEEVGFASMHVFKYSKREGTPAALFKEQVPEDVKNLRSSLMLGLEEKMRIKYQKGLLGKEDMVLFEEKIQKDGKGYWIGHNERYQKIYVPAEEFTEHVCSGTNCSIIRHDAGNEILKVRLNEIFKDGILGNLI